MTELESARVLMPTVLIIDDDETHRYTLRRYLERAGFAVIERITGLEGLAAADSGIDLILLDVNLPDIDGREVCRRIKADPAISSIPVLQISASFVSGMDKVQ